MNDSHPEQFNAYFRRCLVIFAAVVCGTLAMVASSYAPLSSRGLVIALTLTVACVNASLVAGYLMHLLSERKLIYAVLVFTGIFFAGLMILTICAKYDVPMTKG